MSYVLFAMKIVTVGGGTGASRIDEALAKEFPDLTAIVTSFDNGGSSGVLRKEFGVLPYGDIRRRILAQSRVKNNILKQIYDYRFEAEESKNENFLEKHTMGNLMILTAEKIWGVKLGIENICKLFEISGKVLPITFDKAELCAELESGIVLRGEEEIGKRKVVNLKDKKISRLFLDGTVKINIDLENELLNADYIILCPGDFYTSLIPNFLVPGFCEAIHKSKAKIIFVSNIMTKGSETANFKLSDFVIEAEKYLKKKIDFIFFNQTQIVPELIENYRLQEGAEVIVNDMLDDERVLELPLLAEGKLVRHDGKLFLDYFTRIIQSKMNV